MDPTRFSSIARLFSERKISRRNAVAKTGAGIAAAGLGVTAFASAKADHEATPGADQPVPAASPEVVDMVSDDAAATTQLFVQAFESGSIAPSTSEYGTHTVTLAHGIGQTIVFTDRPAREVGLSPTPAFLDGLGFNADNPPNAAMLIDAGDGTTDIAVVELYNPSYDEATHTATYDIAVLDNWQEDLELGFQEEPTDLSNVASEFGATHLFIDGCSGTYYCGWWNQGDPDIRGSFNLPGSWWFSTFGCVPDAPNAQTKEDAINYWSVKCNETFASCENQCTLWW